MQTKEEALETLKLAIDNFVTTKNLDPNFKITWTNWGLALLETALRISDASRGQLLFEAKSKFINGDRIAYSLAKVAAMEGNNKECEDYLKVALDNQDHPDCEHLQRKYELTYFENVKDKPYFIDFKSKICPDAQE